MIEVANIRIPLARAGKTHDDEARAAREALRRRLHLAPDDLTSVEVRRRSIDAPRLHPACDSARRCRYRARAHEPSQAAA